MIYDISPPVSSNLKVWPGDINLSQQELLSISQGDSVNLSAVHASVHLGAHADAPKHYIDNGISIGECEIGSYIGRCQLLDVNIGPFQEVLANHLNTKIVAERVLIRTNTFPNPEYWNNDFAALSPNLIDYLSSCGVKLVGIDTPSIDLYDSKTLLVHKNCYKYNIAILEGLMLSKVPIGIYELIALPLRLMGFDASPVRAILRTYPENPK